MFKDNDSPPETVEQKVTRAKKLLLDACKYVDIAVQLDDVPSTDLTDWLKGVRKVMSQPRAHFMMNTVTVAQARAITVVLTELTLLDANLRGLSERADLADALKALKEHGT